MSDFRPIALPAFVVGHVVRTTNAAEAGPSTALLPALHSADASATILVATT